MAITSPQQGLDTVPYAIYRDNRSFFNRYLPNWSNTGEYNLQIGVTTDKLAVQFDLPVQNGPHPWINEPLDKIIKQIQAGPEHLKTPHLAAVTQFMYEARGGEALTSNGLRTGGWVGYSSLSDPDLARRPTTTSSSSRCSTHRLTSRTRSFCRRNPWLGRREPIHW